jgi:hypothetical protein
MRATNIFRCFAVALGFLAVSPVFGNTVTWTFGGEIQYFSSSPSLTADPLGLVGKSFSGSVTFDTTAGLYYGAPYGMQAQIDGHSFATNPFVEVYAQQPVLQLYAGNSTGLVDGVEQRIVMLIQTLGFNGVIPNNPINLDPTDPEVNGARVFHLTLFDLMPNQLNYQGDLTFFSNGLSESDTVSPVPEPEIYAMMGLGLGLLGWVGRLRKQQAA